ncbi:MAG: hypothetical protein ACKV22_01535 [Bryobacteraceae bacterium]
MNPWIVALAYLAAVGCACILLYWFGPKAWYWHVFSVVAALGVGLIPVPSEWRGPEVDLIIGFCFLLLLIWGAGAPFADRPHRERHA